VRSAKAAWLSARLCLVSSQFFDWPYFIELLRVGLSAKTESWEKDFIGNTHFLSPTVSNHCEELNKLNVIIRTITNKTIMSINR